MRVAPEIVLASDELAELTRLKQSKLTSARLVQRARIVLLAAKGMQNKDIAAELNVGRVQVARWRERFAQFRLAGIERDLPRGAPPSAVDVARLIRVTTQSSSETGKRWSSRTLAAALGISAASVSRHLRANGLKPPLLPRDTMQAHEAERQEPPQDVAALYLSPSGRALVLCCDTAGQAPRPDHAQPKKKGRATSAAPRLSSDDFTGLFAALETLDAKVVIPGKRHRGHAEWLTLLRQIDRETPKGKTLHLITDRAALHRQPDVQKWLSGHKRFTVGLAPAPTPWLDAVKQFFHAMTDGQLRHDRFTSVPTLVVNIEAYVARRDADSMAFIWTRGGGILQEPTRANASAGRKASTSNYANRTRAGSASDAQTGVAAQIDSLRDKVLTLKRDRILQVAAKLFFERGYLQTSVDAIAERLGATKPFVYYHFKSKSDILVEICERSTRSALAAAESAMSDKGSAWLRLERFLREFTNVALHEHQLVAIYFREEISLPAEAAERINQMRKSIDRRLSALLSEGIASGEFQIEDPRIGALVIAGMSSYAFAWYRERGRLEQLEVADRIVRMAQKLVSPMPPQHSTDRIRSVRTA